MLQDLSVPWHLAGAFLLVLPQRLQLLVRALLIVRAQRLELLVWDPVMVRDQRLHRHQK
jgi:hypothetical protein